MFKADDYNTKELWLAYIEYDFKTQSKKTQTHTNTFRPNTAV